MKLLSQAILFARKLTRAITQNYLVSFLLRASEEHFAKIVKKEAGGDHNQCRALHICRPEINSARNVTGRSDEPARNHHRQHTQEHCELIRQPNQIIHDQMFLVRSQSPFDHSIGEFFEERSSFASVLIVNEREHFLSNKSDCHCNCKIDSQNEMWDRFDDRSPVEVPCEINRSSNRKDCKERRVFHTCELNHR
jgi:hypothetical protein